MDLWSRCLALWVLPLRGANAPWIEEEDQWFDGIKERVIERLVTNLTQRIEAVRSGTLDHISTEIRCQIADSAVSGNTYEAADLHELLLELLLARDR